MSNQRCEEAARLCLWVFLGALCVSVGYIFATDRYNGDFMGVPVTLNWWQLSLSFLASLAPYLVGYYIYKMFPRNSSVQTVRVTNRMLAYTFFVVTIWFIVLSIAFDVGTMGQALYDAPPVIKELIQLTNRINPFYLGVFFIVGYRGRKIIIAMGIALLIFLGLLRGGLGILMYVSLALIIRNHSSLLLIIRKHLVVIGLVIFLIPISIAQLYELRNDIRGTQGIYDDIDPVDMVSAILAGRLSSISNSSFIFQEHSHFEDESNQLDPLYYQKQMLAPMFGVQIIPEVIPERLLINVFGGAYTDVSYMAGVPGNLAIAFYINPIIAIGNALLIVLVIILSYFFSSRLGLPYSNEVCFMLMLYPLTSGVANEFSFIMLTMFVFLVIFKVLNLICGSRPSPDYIDPHNCIN